MKSDQNFLVSILMTAYNREAFIAEAIESVLASSYSDFELVIVDDGSKDQTMQIAKSYAEKDKRIQLYQNSRNLGDYPNRNKAASYAKGEILVYVDSDDTIEKDAIAYIVNSFATFPEAGFATLYKAEDIQSPTLIDAATLIEKHFFKQSILHIGPGGTSVRRSLFEKVGGFPEEYGPANDMYYNIRIASHVPVILLPYNYLNYRIHEGQEINNHFAYLYQGYRYFSAIMNYPQLPLGWEKRKLLLNKNKRRFMVNLFQYLRKTGKWRDVVIAIKLAKFTVWDAWTGIFH